MIVNKELYTNKSFIGENECFSIKRMSELLIGENTYHNHEFIEICYIMRGTGIHVIENETFKVQKGDVFIINTDIAHSFYIEDKHNELITYNILFNPEFLDEKLINLNDFNKLPDSYLFKNLWDESAVRADLHIPPLEQEAFDTLVLNMFNELTHEENGFKIILRAYLIELIVKLIRLIASNGDNYINDKHSETVESILLYLKKNYSDNLNLDEISKKSLFSKNYFCRIFKEYTGKTIFEYLSELRIKEAYKLISTTDRTLIDICLAVGFSDYKVFLTCFKKYIGVKPSEIKKDKNL